MPRGRPKLVPKIEPTNLEKQVAQVISRYCGIPGCSEQHHREEAKEIITLINKEAKI